MFDEDYADPGSTEHNQNPLARDGRALRFTATARR